VAFVLGLFFNWQIAGRRSWLAVAFVVYIAAQIFEGRAYADSAAMSATM
jgi:hypothetical protein